MTRPGAHDATSAVRTTLVQLLRLGVDDAVMSWCSDGSRIHVETGAVCGSATSLEVRSMATVKAAGAVRGLTLCPSCVSRLPNASALIADPLVRSAVQGLIEIDEKTSTAVELLSYGSRNDPGAIVALADEYIEFIRQLDEVIAQAVIAAGGEHMAAIVEHGLDAGSALDLQLQGELHRPGVSAAVREYAAHVHGVDLNESKVVVALNAIATLERNRVSAGFSIDRYIEVGMAMVALLMYAPALLRERGVHSIPAWVYELCLRVDRKVLASHPLEMNDLAYIETATVLWSTSQDEVLCDFDRCISAAKALGA